MITYKEEVFVIKLLLSSEQENQILYDWSKEVVDYRLHAYFEREAKKKQ